MDFFLSKTIATLSSFITTKPNLIPSKSLSIQFSLSLSFQGSDPSRDALTLTPIQTVYNSWSPFHRQTPINVALFPIWGGNRSAAFPCRPHPALASCHSCVYYVIKCLEEYPDCDKRWFGVDLLLMRVF